jgi:predicted nucleic acid-binding protein
LSLFVLDASIVLTWCFPDEHSDIAEHVAAMFKHGDSAIAPSFWPHEILNALLAGEKRKRITKTLITSFLDELVQLPVELTLVATDGVFERIHSLSREHGLTAYDAAYLDAALETKLPLATLDADLARACKNAGGVLIS